MRERDTHAETVGPEGEKAALAALLKGMPGLDAVAADQCDAVAQRAIALIDEQLTLQVNKILHHPNFQRLEAAWRSLEDLVQYAHGKRQVRIRMLDVSWSEITRDAIRAVEFDQSLLFQKIYSAEYDVPGGEPYGVIVADFSVSHRPFPGHPEDDVPTLERLAEIGAAAFAPIIVNAAPALLGLNDFSTLGQPLRLQEIFRGPEYIPWNRLRAHPDSRFMAITLPRVLLRPAHERRQSPRGGFIYNERASRRSPAHQLWGHACFALAKVLIREFSEVGWFSHIRGLLRDHNTGGLVSDLVIDRYEEGIDPLVLKPVSEVVLGDDQEKVLSELGFTPFCQTYDLPMGIFYSTPSLHRSEQFDDSLATANARLASLLQHVLCSARFAHYIKVMVRDKIGAFVRADQCERQLQNWVNQFVASQEDADWAMQARYPLREAQVKVSENAERPGTYWTTLHLRPHYQADRLVSELALSTELVPGGR